MDEVVYTILICAGAFVGLCIVIGIIASFFVDIVNSICCILIGIAGIIFSIIVSSNHYYYDMIVEYNNTGDWLWISCLIFYAFMVIRYLPCISIETEKNTYLILGTLVEDVEHHALGAGIAFGVPLLFAIPYYFLCPSLIEHFGVYSPMYVVFIFLFLHATLGLIRAIKQIVG